MSREELEARLAQLQAERQRAAQQVEEWTRALLRLEGGIGEARFLLEQGEKGGEDDGS